MEVEESWSKADEQNNTGFVPGQREKEDYEGWGMLSNEEKVMGGVGKAKAEEMSEPSHVSICKLFWLIWTSFWESQGAENCFSKLLKNSCIFPFQTHK